MMGAVPPSLHHEDEPLRVPITPEKIRGLVESVFGLANTHLGAREARLLFASFGKKPVGRPRKQPFDGRDWWLYKRYCVAIAYFSSGPDPTIPKESLPRHLAEAVYKARGCAFGSSAAAIEKRLRRLLSKMPRLLLP
jgi:hypothetical protein